MNGFSVETMERCLACEADASGTEAALHESKTIRVHSWLKILALIPEMRSEYRPQASATSSRPTINRWHKSYFSYSSY